MLPIRARMNPIMNPPPLSRLMGEKRSATTPKIFTLPEFAGALVNASIPGNEHYYACDYANVAVCAYQLAYRSCRR